MSLSKRENKRIHNGLPVAREGIPFIVVGIICTLLFVYVGWLFLAILLGIVTIFIISFFRDPDREKDVHDDTVLIPADGKILEIQQLKANIRRERQQLRNLTAMQLRDIGISRNDALTEAKRHDLLTERAAFICQRRQSG